MCDLIIALVQCGNVIVHQSVNFTNKTFRLVAPQRVSPIHYRYRRRSIAANQPRRSSCSRGRLPPLQVTWHSRGAPRFRLSRSCQQSDGRRSHARHGNSVLCDLGARNPCRHVGHVTCTSASTGVALFEVICLLRNMHRGDGLAARRWRYVLSVAGPRSIHTQHRGIRYAEWSIRRLGYSQAPLTIML